MGQHLLAECLISVLEPTRKPPIKKTAVLLIKQICSFVLKLNVTEIKKWSQNSHSTGISKKIKIAPELAEKIRKWRSLEKGEEYPAKSL